MPYRPRVPRKDYDWFLNPHQAPKHRKNSNQCSPVFSADEIREWKIGQLLFVPSVANLFDRLMNLIDDHHVVSKKAERVDSLMNEVYALRSHMIKSGLKMPSFAATPSMGPARCFTTADDYEEANEEDDKAGGHGLKGKKVVPSARNKQHKADELKAGSNHVKTKSRAPSKKSKSNSDDEDSENENEINKKSDGSSWLSDDVSGEEAYGEDGGNEDEESDGEDEHSEGDDDLTWFESLFTKDKEDGSLPPNKQTRVPPKRHAGAYVVTDVEEEVSEATDGGDDANLAEDDDDEVSDREVQ